MKVAIIGTHGIPGNYGGFETFAEEISVFFAESNHEVLVQCDHDSYQTEYFKGVKLFYSSVTKSQNPFRYYYEGLRIAMRQSDVLIVTGVGGAIFYFINLFYKKILITNTDGIESKRSKWPVTHKIFLKYSERLAVRLSDFVIADSDAIKKHLSATYKFATPKIRTIEYGAPIISSYDQNVIDKYDIRTGGYYLVVCRLEPENNIRMIIDGFLSSDTDKDLVIIGNLSGNKYDTRLIKECQSNRIRFLGGIYDKSELSTIRFACKAYIHGHSVGGTNPSLLEALGCGNITICHDNVFNREVTADNQLYFNSSGECKERINEVELMSPAQILKLKESGWDRINNQYNWETVFKKYLNLLEEVSVRNQRQL
jgi:glycosyltransferase involved in cell wall biosynthesis